MDAYGESLLFVNRLYNGVYGHARREVPGHIPYFVDREALEALHEKFPKVKQLIKTDRPIATVQSIQQQQQQQKEQKIEKKPAAALKRKT